MKAWKPLFIARGSEMKHTWRIGFALLLSLCSAIAGAVPYSDLYVFGDSLSDQGNVSLLTGGAAPPPEYTDGSTYGRFTNGRNYIDYLAQDLGLSVTPSLLGGTNYAYGGARTSYQVWPIPGAQTLLQQRDAYLASLGGGSANASALYVVWAGANNLADILTQLAANPGYDPSADLAGAVGDLASVVTSLVVAGAHSIVVPNIPDLGLVPAVTGGGAPNPGASYLTGIFNQALSTALDQIDALFPAVDLIRIDTFSLLDAVYMNPAAYGLTNVSTGCYSLYALPGGTTCANPQEYLFWDAMHPTTATHRILADTFLHAVPEPATLLLVGVGLLPLARGRGRRAAQRA